MCHLGYQMINGACAFAIGLLEEPGYEHQRSQRIKKTKASVSIQDIQKEYERDFVCLGFFRRKENQSRYSYKNYFPRKSERLQQSKEESKETKQQEESNTSKSTVHNEIPVNITKEQKKPVGKAPSMHQQQTKVCIAPKQPSKRVKPKNMLKQYLITIILFLKRYFLIFLNYLIEWIRLLTRTILCFITFFIPNCSFILKRKNEDRNEALHLSLTPGEIELSADDIPGLIEDLQFKCFQIIDDLTLVCRKIWSYGCNPYNYIAGYKALKKWIHSPTKINDIRNSLNIPSFSTILKGYLFDLDAYTAPTLQDVNRKDRKSNKPTLARGLLGFPLEEYTVHTRDGYCIILFRIPNKETKKIVYLQHGVMDTAFAWISNTSNDSMATICYEQGYDVFFGSFRGTDGHYHSERIKHEVFLFVGFSFILDLVCQRSRVLEIYCG